jgi:glycosyltransferase involved in cell wall biosynthesis
MNTNFDQRNFDVIHVTNEFASGKLGGVGTVVEHLVASLRKVGVRALCFLVKEDEGSDQWHDQYSETNFLARGRMEDLRSYCAPLLHVHCYQPHEKLLEVCRERPSLYTVHSLLLWEAQSNDIDLTPSIRWQEELIAAVDRVVVISAAERDAYTRLGYLDINPFVSIVYNGLRPSGLFRSPRGVETIGFCGRLVPRKRPEYPQLILNEPRFCACRTLMAGRGFSPYARDLIAREKLHGRVEYLGWCTGSRLEAFFDRIDVLTMPSTYEPFGLAALEAMERGIPVVCPGAGGLSEVLGDHAYCYDGTSFEAFTSAITRWIDSTPSERDAMARAAFHRYRDRFTDTHMAQAYAAVYAGMGLVRGTSLDIVDQTAEAEIIEPVVGGLESAVGDPDLDRNRPE